jgi:hypothetical protein
MTTDLEWYRDGRQTSAAQHIDTAISTARSNSSTQRSDDMHYLRLYDEREWSLTQLELGGQTAASSTRGQRPRKSRRLSRNVVKSCVDGWSQLICENRPHVNYLTKGADWSLQKNARMRTRFVEAHFLKRGIYKKAHTFVKHAGIVGRGFVQVVRAHGRIDYEVVPFWEIVVDPFEALVNDPRCIYRDRTIDKFVLAELFPKHAKAILAMTETRIRFVDAWHLPSGPDAGDGVHMQVIPGKLLLDSNEYRWDEFPVVEFFCDVAPVSWGGQGIASDIEGDQYEINDVLRTIQNNVYFGGAIRAFLEKGSSVAPSDVSNALGCPAVMYSGKEPTIHVADLGLAQLLGYLDQLTRGCFEKTGISQANVMSQTPAASQSGRSRLIQNQAYSRRFVTHQQRYEDFFQRLADRTLEAAADLDEAGENVTIMFPGRRQLETISYRDIKAGERDDFDCTAWTASLAGETPAARLAHIDQMMSLGMIDMAAALELYEIPMDLRAHAERVLAPRELAREVVDRIIEDGVPMTPFPMMDLKLADEYAMTWYQRGELNGVPWQKLQLLVDFHNMCQELLARAQAPANQGAPAPTATAAPTGPDLSATLAPAPVAPILAA